MKAFAILFVVIGHVMSGCYSENMSSMDDIILFRFIYSFHMPLFFFISGFVCFNPDKDYSKKSIGKRSLSYLIPFFVSGLLIGLVRNEISLMQLWYFRTLTVFMLFLYCSQKIARFLLSNSFAPQLKPLLAVVLFYGCIRGISFLTSHPLINMMIDGYHFWFYIFFALGFLYRSYRYKFDNILRNDVMLLLSFFAMILVYYLDFNLYYLKQFAAIVFVLNIASLCCFEKSLLANRIGRCTGEIYIIHFFLVMALPQVGDFFMYFKSMSPKIQLLPQLLYSVPMSLFIIWLSMKIVAVVKCSPLLSIALLGDMSAVTKKLKKD